MQNRFHELPGNAEALVHSLTAAMRDEQAKHTAAPAGEATPFVTISRQAGVGGWTFGELLARKLTELDPEGRPWKCWDRELVAHIAAEHQLAERLVEALEGPGRTWLEELFDAVRPEVEPNEWQIMRQAAATITALAQAGRAVIVGLGGVYVTAGRTGGVHLRLVAPLPDRIDHTARQLKVDRAEAAEQVHRVDQRRRALHRRLWAGGEGREAEPELFHLTLNTARAHEQTLVRCVLPLIQSDASPDGRLSGDAIGKPTALAGSR